MKCFIIAITFLAAILITGYQAFAAEVVMIKWLDKSILDQEFESRLKQLSPDVKIRYIKSHRDKKLLLKELKYFDFSNIDLVYSFGTTCTKIVKEHLKGRTPHVFNAVSTPVLSGIANSIAKPGGNLTGARLLVGIEDQIDLLTKLKKIKTLAVWFDPRERQSVDVLKKLVKISKQKNITITPFRIIPDAKIFDKMLITASAASNKLDALYFVTSASFHLNYKKLHSKLSPSLLVMGGIRNYVENGSTIALGPDVTERSRTLAAMASQILSGTRPNDIPISQVTSKNAILFANKEKLKSAGVQGVQALNIKTIYIEKK